MDGVRVTIFFLKFGQKYKYINILINYTYNHSYLYKYIYYCTKIMNEVKNCLIINLDSRPDLWNNTVFFRNKWTKIGKQLTRISGVDYKNKQNVLNDFIITNRINLNATGLRNTKS